MYENIGNRHNPVVVLNRFKGLGVPSNLRADFFRAFELSRLEHSEESIIQWFMKEHEISRESAARVLRGNTTLEQELGTQNAP